LQPLFFNEATRTKFNGTSSSNLIGARQKKHLALHPQSNSQKSANDETRCFETNATAWNKLCRIL